MYITIALPESDIPMDIEGLLILSAYKYIHIIWWKNLCQADVTDKSVLDLCIHKLWHNWYTWGYSEIWQSTTEIQFLEKVIEARKSIYSVRTTFINQSYNLWGAIRLYCASVRYNIKTFINITSCISLIKNCCTSL